ncbi:MAG: hypothetical protein CSA20_02995 [Deltaproteobacteria bacterium]|nr:MAG: hypothetical protein CSA20_02995 [Deltaproteobacteria bacterium]
MNIIFCEECGSRNTIEDDVLRDIEKKAISCQVCGFLISAEHLINHTGPGKLIDTSTYKILVIDDDTSHLTLLQTALQKEYTVHIAASGQEGIETAVNESPDLILLDVSMPGMDGYEVCSTLKRDKKTRHIPVIFITAKTRGDEEYKGLSVGAIDYIVKPFNIRILNAKIASHLKFKAMRDELRQKIAEQKSHIKSLRDDILREDGTSDELYQLQTNTVEKGENSGNDKNTDLEKQHLIDIVNALNDFISIQDINGRILWANTSMIKAFGLLFFELQEKKCYNLYWERTAPCEGCICADTELESPTPPVERFSPRLKQSLLQTGLALHDKNKNIVAVACTTQPLQPVAASRPPDPGSLPPAAEDFPAIHLGEFNDAISTLLVSSDTMYNMYKDDKNLARINQYISDASNKLRILVGELSKQIPQKKI